MLICEEVYLNLSQLFQEKTFVKDYKNLRKIVKFEFKGLLMRSIDHFDHVDLFVDLTLLNIIAVYSLSLSIINFKIITKNNKFP